MNLIAWTFLVLVLLALLHMLVVTLLAPYRQQPRHVPKHRRPSGDLLRDEADDDERFEEPLDTETPAELARLNEDDAWPGEVGAGSLPWEDAR